MMISGRTKEDVLIGKIKELIGNMESRIEAVEKGRLNSFEVGDLIKRIEAVWEVLERRTKERPDGRQDAR
jgi:hypothetical protein